jgi:HupE / UreJ protein
MFIIFRRAILLTVACAWAMAGHDIPNDVLVQAYLKPSVGHLRLLVRVPVAALRDINFPERPQGYMDLARSRDLLPDAAIQWIADAIEIQEGDTPLGRPQVKQTQLSLISDKSFASFETALAHTMGEPLPETTNVFWNQAMLDVLFEYPIQSENSRFSIHPGLARLGQRVVTVLRFLPPGGAVRAFEFTGDPGLVHLDPSWHQAAFNFVRLGFFHILDGTDHLLFLFCLVIPIRRLWALVPVVTSFTAAHSITLIASAYGLAPDALWFPPLIEALIAASIVWMALENIVESGSQRHRWIVAFGFGLVHGFGFSFALRETLQFAGTHLLTSLLSFNVGVELGQLLVLALMIPFLNLLFRVVAERMGTIILSALVAHTGWHWMVERWDRFRQFRFSWPVLTAAAMASLMGWLTFGVILGGLLWLATRIALRPSKRIRL